MAELVEWTFMALESSTTKAPALAHEALRKLHGTLAQFFPAEVEAWENELVADLDALDPLDPEELDDLQRYLVRPLWGAKVTERSDLAEVARKRLAMLRAAGSEVSAASLSLLDRYELHLSGGS